MKGGNLLANNKDISTHANVESPRDPTIPSSPQHCNPDFRILFRKLHYDKGAESPLGLWVYNTLKPGLSLPLSNAFDLSDTETLPQILCGYPVSISKIGGSLTARLDFWRVQLQKE